MTHEQIIDSMKVLAARLSLAVYFRYLTVEWNEIRNAPIYKIWENKPTYRKGIDDYGYDWEAWNGGPDDETWIGAFSGKAITGTSLGALPKDTDWSSLIVENKEREA